MRVLLWVVVAAAVAAIVMGSLMSSGVMTRFPPGISPGMTHLLAYTALGGLMALALHGRRHGVLLALGITVLIGMGVEFSQMLVPVRTFSFFDLGMNVIGAGIGVLVGWFFGVLVGRWGGGMVNRDW